MVFVGNTIPFCQYHVEKFCGAAFHSNQDVSHRANMQAIQNKEYYEHGRAGFSVGILGYSRNMAPSVNNKC